MIAESVLSDVCDNIPCYQVCTHNLVTMRTVSYPLILCALIARGNAVVIEGFLGICYVLQC